MKKQDRSRENRPGVYVHIYGKTVSKPKRKMGHVTFVGVTGEEYAACLLYTSR